MTVTSVVTINPVRRTRFGCITGSGKNKVTELRNGEITTYYIDPEEYGIRKAKISDLVGGMPQENAVTLKLLLDGEKNTKRDILLLNAAAGLYVAERVKNIGEGIGLAAETIDSGRASLKLERLIEISQSLGKSGS